jgi:hypothetical protein
MSGAESVAAISALMTREPNPQTEIEDALASARGERNELAIRWPNANAKQIEAITQNDGERLGLWHASSTPIEYSGAEEVIDVLFPGNPWLCIGQSNRLFATRRREKWRGYLSERSLIVPSPMLDQRGLIKSGVHQSHHALSNTGPRRFLIIESDHGGLDEQAAVIWHLAKICPLAAVVFSAAKSLHGWFFCLGQPEHLLLKFMQYAVSLGADKKMWTPSQFCRLPNGHRDDEKITNALQLCGWSEIPLGSQALLYLNHKAVR